MGQTSFGARRVGDAADLLYTMANDPECFVVLTITGAMTVAKLGLVIAEMIEQGMVHAVVATGALITHGLVEGQGLTHFKVPPGISDPELFARGYNRVYDTLETETNLDQTQLFLQSVLVDYPSERPLTTWELCRQIGKALVDTQPGRGPLRSAYECGVPIFIPAFTDCEMGLDFHVHNKLRIQKGLTPLAYDAFGDLEAFAQIVEGQKNTAIFTIGGGVPRNWAQQVSPYLDLLAMRTGKGNNFKPYRYGVRICPDPAHFGHLSGCTYSESVSWGKLIPKDEGGRWVEVLSDATIAWPLIVQAARERLQREGKLPLRKQLAAAPAMGWSTVES
jgi:deoxyhypusine synthase